MATASILPVSLDLLLTFESARIELKASWDEKATGPQVLRTIAAFANDFQNLNGGYVVIGVEAPDGAPVLPPRGLDPGHLEGIQRWIRGQCKRMEPEYRPVFSPETKDGRHLLVIWVPPSDVRPHSVPETLDKGAPRSYYVRVGSETIKATGETLHQLIALTARIPFDDRRALGVSLEKIREQKVREFLAEVRSGLLAESDSREIYRRMRLSAPINGHEVPKNVALLFFSDDPEEWFSGARIEVVQFAADAAGNVLEERIFRGPLDRQLRDALRYLEGLSTQHLEKLHDRPETRGWVSFPHPALEESLANAIYHRSYEGTPEPTKVYLYPDRIEVISYPGPVPGIEARHFEPGAKVPPVSARNRRIGEIFKELRLAEARGTGVPKIFRAMLGNGSPPPSYDFDSNRSYFRVTLPAHPEYVAISTLRDAAHLRAVGDLEGALFRLRRAFEESPASETLAAALIAEIGHRGDLSGARQVLERYLSAPGRSSGVRARIALATAFLDAGRTEEAKPILSELSDLSAPSEAIEAAILERRAGRQEKAHRLFKGAGEAVYLDPRALHEFAQTKIRLADPKHRGRRPYATDARKRLLGEARDMLRRVLQMDAPTSRHAWAWFDLGRVLRWLDAPRSEVRRALEEAARLDPYERRFRDEVEKLTVS